jgi:hypothetical protein
MPPFGSYDPDSFVVTVNQPRGDLLALEDIDAFIRDHPDIDVQARRAIAGTTLLHEVRHLYDCLGTIAGVSLFEGQLRLMRRFLDAIGSVQAGMLQRNLPLDAWIGHDDCPTAVKQFAGDQRLFLERRRVFMGDVDDLCGEPTVTDEPWCRLEIGAGRLPLIVYPARLHTLRLQNRELFNERSVHCPVGFQTFAEAQAHSLQDAVIRNTWSARVADRVVEMRTERQTVIAQAPDTEEFGRDAQLTVQPYATLQLLVAKFLRIRHRVVGELPATVVTQLADAVLMRVACPLPGSTEAFRAPGDEMIALMEDADWEHRLEGVLWTSSQGENGVKLRALVERWRVTIPAIDQLTAQGRQVHAVDIIESYIVHALVIPLFELRLKYGDAVMFDAAMYLEHLHQFPRPPFILWPDGLGFGPDVPEIVRTAWCEYSLLADIVRQVVENEGTLWCNRAGKAIPGLETFDLAFEGSCETHAHGGACGYWRSSQVNKLPPCVFSRVMRAAGFVKAPSFTTFH